MPIQNLNFVVEDDNYIVLEDINSAEKLLALIDQVVGNTRNKLSQKRLAEILSAIIKLIPGTSSGSGSGGGNSTATGITSVAVSFKATTRDLLITVNGVSGANKIAINRFAGVYNTKAEIDGLFNTIVGDTAFVMNTAGLIGGVAGVPGFITKINSEWSVYSLASGGGGGGTSLYEYNAGSNVRVVATDFGVSAIWNTGVLTITIPPNVQVLSTNVLLVDGSNIQSGQDAGGTANWIRIKFENTGDYNTAKANMKVPIVQKTVCGGGEPSLSTPYGIDLDNNPGITVVDVSNNSITIRIGNLVAPSGYNLSITNI